ncbi:MAG: XRE family transcriptional regulator [Bacteroidota bacterium]
MVINKQNIRLIFGLKLRQLRIQRGLSFAQLSKAAGVSVSYLNEIEKGKKYPKTDKIISLAEALGVSYDQLVSLKLNKKLSPIAELLNSGILDSLPLEMFGLEPSTLLELISTAPSKINAFISTILKIARNYEMSQENFFLAALRSYQEMHNNYFEDLEEQVAAFTKEYGLDTHPPITHQSLREVLIQHFGYTIDSHSLDQYEELRTFRSVYVNKSRHLFINPRLTDRQQAFLLGKELAFHYLNLTNRPETSSMFEVKNFDEVLNNFKASYFSVALLLNREEMVNDLETIFSHKHWDSKGFTELMEKYQASPEMFISRITNLLPRFFEIDNFFFLRFNDFLDSDVEHFHITKELHLNQMHRPHRNELNEHYCRRWVSIRILQSLKKAQVHQNLDTDYLMDVQKSRYMGTKSEYFCISVARPNSPTPHSNVSVTLGVFVDATSKRKMKFLDHPDIPVREVSETCERCALTDCAERVAPPTVIERKQDQKQIKARLRELKHAMFDPATEPK